MKVLLQGIETNKKQVTFNRGLNFGRFNGRSTKAYEIHISEIEFINLIEKEYDEIRDEIELDDKAMSETSHFSNTNYCSLTELLKYESDFEAIVTTYLDRLLFAKLFTESTESKYVINSTDAIKVHDNLIIFKGKIFELEV